MKDLFKNIQTLLIIVLVILLFLQRSCSSNYVSEPKVITETVTKWDTVSITKTKYIPKWKTRTETIYDTIPSSIDTVAILKDYYAKYFYTDTIKLDTLGSIVINDTVTKNLISFRDVQSNIFIPTTTITNTIYLYKREFYGGFSVGINNELAPSAAFLGSAIQNVSGELLYINRKREAYGFGVGLTPDFQPIFTGRMYWKIGK